MVDHPDIDKISFTGSIATGKKIMANAAKTLKRVGLELGGNDAAIVLPDVDIAKVAPMVALGAFGNSGQICVATKRVFVHKDIYEPFLKAMTDFVKTALKVGEGHEDGVMIGPIQNRMQYDKVKTFFEDTKKNGYKFAIGEPDVQKSKGYFISPTIIDNPPTNSMIVAEEPFGPIIPCQSYEDVEEAIRLANDINVGLGASVFAKDVKVAEAIGRRLEAGTVSINNFLQADPRAPFGGHKQSGIGMEWGSQGLIPYTNLQSVHVWKGEI
jgi:acyl-CoA reductase-like NAD-dependent aldehyde dehydrogenase